MGLDAHVHCDCVETGRLTKPHPFPELLRIAPDGMPNIDSHDEAQKESDWQWFISGACAHQNFQLLSIRLGNIAFVAEVRASVDKIAAHHQTQFPVLRDQVIYGGSHCGDYLDLKQVETLASEIVRLRALSWESLQVERNVGRWFLWQSRFAFDQPRADGLADLDELIEVSRSVGKPICF